jgi:hypothetical protein
MAAEEREFYPVIRKAIPEGASLVEDAVKEHQEAKGLLAELARLDLGTFDMDAKVATLRKRSSITSTMMKKRSSQR